MSSDLVEDFNRHFEMVPALSDELKKQVYALRYQVYCVETGFEDHEKCLVEYDLKGEKTYLEKDQYDGRSCYYLIRHRNTGLYAATVRLVLPDYANLQALFPIESYCALTHKVTDPSARAQLAEVSRFAVSKHFKRRLGEANSFIGISEYTERYYTADERRITPHITIGLLAALMRMTLEKQITQWYAVMEPALFRLLQRFGFSFDIIGPPIAYRGVRYPGFAKIDELVPNIQKACFPVWALTMGETKSGTQ
jgi:N-acyl amino acid synthase of PEP-CTERM/exosortase system